jgi:hypothetical protein
MCVLGWCQWYENEMTCYDMAIEEKYHSKQGGNTTMAQQSSITNF